MIGSIVYPAAELVAPGVVRVIEGNRFTLGELDGSRSERIEALSQAFIRAGFKAPVSKDIRSEIWLKLWGNLSFNPISALTRATLEDICAFEPTRALAAQMMREAQAIGEALGVEFKVSLDSASPAPPRSARTRPRCCRTSRRSRARARSAGRRGGRTRPHHRPADADHRRGVRAGQLLDRSARP